MKETENIKPRIEVRKSMTDLEWKQVLAQVSKRPLSESLNLPTDI